MREIHVLFTHYILINNPKLNCVFSPFQEPFNWSYSSWRPLKVTTTQHRRCFGDRAEKSVSSLTVEEIGD